MDISKEKLKFIEFMLYINHVLEFIYIKMLVMPQPIVKKKKEKKKRKEKKGSDFMESHTPHLPICSPPHILTKYLTFSLWPAIPHFALFSFLFSQTH